MGYLKAQTMFEIPRTTLHRFVKLAKTNLDTSIDDSLKIDLGRKSVFSADLEQELASHCLDMEQKFWLNKK